MRSLLVILYLLFNLSVYVFPQNITALKGSVIDSDTKVPLIGVNIIIKSTGEGTTTDENGNFIFDNLKAGTYLIDFSYIGYEKVTKSDIVIKTGRTNFITIDMKPSLIEMEQAVVTSGYFSEIKNKPVGTVNFSSEEIRRAPGSAGDVSRIMYGLPSLAKVNDSRNSLIVRGGSPIENTFYIDNIEVPNINHYPVEGSSDGPIGILNVDFIRDVTFYTGGFSAAYGDKLSSIMKIDYREGNKDNFEPQLYLSMAGAGGAIEGPIGENANYLFSFNKSYLDLVVDKAETGGALPQYGDIQGKLTLNLDNKNKLTFLEILSIDEINLTYEDALKSDLTVVYGSTDGFMNASGINWQSLWNDKFHSNTSIGHIYNKYNRNYSETKSQREVYKNTSIENTLSLRNLNFYKINKSNSFEIGFDSKLYLNDFNFFYGESQDRYGNISPAIEVVKNSNSLKAGFFTIYNYQVSDKIRFEYGVRGDYFTLTKNINVSPRMTFNYNINPDFNLTASFGKFYQEIPNHILVQDDSFLELNTPQSLHSILGIGYMITPETRLTIEGYYKSYSDFPMDPNQPQVFIFDEALQEGIMLHHDNLDDNGEAFSAGVEIMIQKKLAQDFYGMISASYSRTRFKDYGGIWRDRIYDNKYNFNIEGGYIPNDEWEFKLRWIYAGGAPYTPYDIEKSKEFNEGIWDLNNFNSMRLPDYHSLNIRVDKRFYFDNSSMIIYLSVWNAYGRENIAQYIWDEVKNEQGKLKQWSTLPVIGIEYKF